MTEFEEDTKKILDFFDNKELQDIFEENFIHKEEIRIAWEKKLLKAKEISEQTNNARFVFLVNELFYDDVVELRL